MLQVRCLVHGSCIKLELSTIRFGIIFLQYFGLVLFGLVWFGLNTCMLTGMVYNHATIDTSSSVGDY